MKTRLRNSGRVVLVAAGWMVIGAAELHGQTIQWVRQIGGAGDSSNAVGANANGSVFIGGLTFGNLDGQHPGGVWEHFGDAFVTKTDSTGYYYGSRQLGLGGRFQDITYGAAVDDWGNLFIAGSTEGGMNGSFAGGYTDGFIYKMRGSDGATLGLKQVGTLGNDMLTGVAVDGLGNGYATGYVGGNLDGSPSTGSDAIVMQYAAVGAGWIKQIGSAANDQGFGISADSSGNVYVAGVTTGNFGGANAGGLDGFLTKMDNAGNIVWTRQAGTGADDQYVGVSADALGNVYIVGATYGSLAQTNAGASDAIVSKFDPSGTMIWTRQFGTSADDKATSAVVDGRGNVFVAGSTGGNLYGTNAGNGDAFVTMYSDLGVPRWTLQFGTSTSDSAAAVATDGLGNVYVTGSTGGVLNALGAPYDGSGGNAFLVKILSTTPAADFNNDGVVNASDLSAWMANAGIAAGATGARGDADGDGDVDGADFMLLQRELTAPAPPSDQSATPEPASSSIAAVATIALLCGFGRRLRCTQFAMNP